MRKLFLFIPVVLFFSCGKSDQVIFQETIDELNALSKVSHTTEATLQIKKGEKSERYKATCYFDFSGKDQFLGAKYHFVSDNGDEEVYNGNGLLFTTSQKEQTVLFTDGPRKNQVVGSKFSSGSLLEVRKLLPKFLKDNSITYTKKKDTTIQGVSCYRYDFVIPNRYVAYHELVHAGKLVYKYVYTYQIAISKGQMLPVFVQTKNSQSERVSTYVHSDINTDTAKEDSVWDYKRFSDSYAIMSQKDYNKRKRNSYGFKSGFEISNYRLRNVLDGSDVSLYGLKGKLTLLQFWFPNCKACIDAIPIVNEIQKKYKDQGLSVVGVEFTRRKNLGLNEYIEEKGIEIKNVYIGQDIAVELGVYAAPTFVIFNDKNKIVYRHTGVDKEGLIRAIEANL